MSAEHGLTWITIEFEDGTVVEGVACQGLLLHNAEMTDYLVDVNTPEGVVGRR